MGRVPVQPASRVRAAVPGREFRRRDARGGGWSDQVSSRSALRSQRLLQATPSATRLPSPHHLHERHALLGGNGTLRLNF